MICCRCSKDYKGRKHSKYCSKSCSISANLKNLTNENKEIVYDVNENGCHICTSHRTASGYPTIKNKGKSVNISRYLYEKEYGEIPNGLIVRHKCDNPKCINISHLEIGTHQDNMNDMKERSSKHKLTKYDVEYIRNNCLTANEASKLFDCNISTLQRVISRHSWKNV